jgi:hypothetical protein
MRVKTATTRRTIDKWRQRAGSEATRFYVSTTAMVAYVLSAPRRGRYFLIVPTALAVSLNFAFLELAVIILIGFFTAKLHCYRLVNSVLKFMPQRL